MPNRHQKRSVVSFFISGFFAAVMILIAPSVSTAYKVPDTGQMLCYDNGLRIPCPDPWEAFFGQDGQYQGNQPTFSNNGNGTVNDLNTGLTWQQGDDQNSTYYTWQKAADYCTALALGGYDDWRLPFRGELLSIVNYGRTAPAIDKSIFPSCRSRQYWTATTQAFSHGPGAWFVNFYDGSISTESKDLRYRVRCVRGNRLPRGYFKDNLDGTISDTRTGLTWQQSRQPATWEGALSYCQELNLAGHADWRLPNVRELETIVDDSRYDPALPPSLSCSSCSWSFWSSSTRVLSPQSAWQVHFFNGDVLYDGLKTEATYFRCVRGGSIHLNSNALPVPLLSQNNPEWACKPLGLCASTDSLGEYKDSQGKKVCKKNPNGCNVTAQAMIFNYYAELLFGSSAYTDPAKLNEEITNTTGGFAQCHRGQGDYCCFHAPAAGETPIGAPDSVVYKGSATNSGGTGLSDTVKARIDKALDAYNPVLADVRYPCKSDPTNGCQHYVVIIGKNVNTYWINDPWRDDKRYTLDRGAINNSAYTLKKVYLYDLK